MAALENRLIETWDVLKHCAIKPPPWAIWINRNMRCIETIHERSDCKGNRWLIETWDVLKLGCGKRPGLCKRRLIETWDVLKQGIQNSCKSLFQINRNMRCIETNNKEILSLGVKD